MLEKYKTDIFGKKYGMLTAIRFIDSIKKRGSRWLFRCDCGKEVIMFRGVVVPGYAKSCGCSRLKYSESMTLRTDKFNFIPDEQYKKIINTYNGMIYRCYCNQSKCYHRYGGRGIGVCKEWLEDKANFIAWAYNKGLKCNLTLDRINNDGNYSPDNCRVVSLSDNANNKWNNHLITVAGETLTITQHAIKRGIPRNRIYVWCSRYTEQEVERRILAS